IVDSDREFYEKVSPIFNGQKFLIPEPTLCPDCREQRRLAVRNERKLYRRKCDLCQRNIISVYHDQAKFPVYCTDCWWSDKWDSTQYAREFDFNRPFFEQFHELQNIVPRIHLSGRNNENSEFVNQETDDKNCYMNVGGHYNEDCYYCTYSIHGRNNVDCYWVIKSELLYQCIQCNNCYNCVYLQNCDNCNNCLFCQSCIGCSDCFGCYGLQRAKFYWFNEKLSEEEYKKRKQEYLNSPSQLTAIREKSLEFFQRFPQKYAQILQCEDCTGDYLERSKNSKAAFCAENLQDSNNIYIGLDLKDCQDCASFGWAELCYECSSSGIEVNNCLFMSYSLSGLHNVIYSSACLSSDNLFACVGMNRKSYCILNKQYTKDEYFELLPKIITNMIGTKEWGEFFPVAISPFGYNETVANEYFPLTRDQALAKGFPWSDYESPKPQATKIITRDKLSVLSDITKIPDEVSDWAIECEVTGKLFRIIPQELKFYRKQNLPIPRQHPDQRHVDRLASRNPRKLWHRVCDKKGCKAEFESSYSPERMEKVYCEKCYLESIF
ncbi:MAG: hypothetical protein NTZ80_00420, partial [Patescibacteria group bacterium]|nr:hypothetical protein [Patescibacteria group bacterium]